MNKVVVFCKKGDREGIEEALSPLTLQGVEIIFSEKEEMTLIQNEKPKVIFLDRSYPELKGTEIPVFPIPKAFAEMLDICQKHLDLPDALKEIPM